METFGILNLLKSLLSSEGQPISPTINGQKNPTDNGAKQTENPAASSPDPQSEHPTSTEQTPERNNACEEYLLRHERLSRSRKK